MKKLLISLLAALHFLQAGAATYYVSASGNDANDGVTIQAAWKTLQFAADNAIAGDTVLIADGNYRGFSAMDQSGTASAPIVFKAINSAAIINLPCSYNNNDGINIENVDYIVVEGFKVNGMPRAGIRIALSDHTTVKNNICTGNYKWGIFTAFADYVTLEGNECSYSTDEHGIYHSNSGDHAVISHNISHHNNRCGIHMNGDISMGGDGILSDASVYGNIIYENGVAGGSGINCDGVIDSRIFNNLLYENHASGISLYQIDGGAPSTGNLVYNNTIVNADDARWCVNITDDCTGNKLKNNILINQHPWRGSIVIAASALQGFVSDYNIVTGTLSPDGDATLLSLAQWQNLGYDQHSQLTGTLSSMFVNALSGDFHPSNASAMMIDAGTASVNPVVTTDLDGNVRPQGSGYDIGAFEWSSALSVPDGTPLSHIQLMLEGSDYFLQHCNEPVTIIYYDAAGRMTKEYQVNQYTERVLLELPDKGITLIRVLNKNGTQVFAGKLIR